MRDLSLLSKKKIIVLLFFSLLFKNGFAQYDSLVVDHAVWIVQAYMQPQIYPVDTAYGYYINGDTVDGGIAYKKVYMLFFKNHTPQGAPTYSPYVITGQQLYAFVRESNDTIYAKIIGAVFQPQSCQANIEFVLHNYNYLVGDTLDGCINNIPYQTVDSIVYPSAFSHRAFFVDGSYYYLIEGIGSNKGLFEPYLPAFSGFCHFELVSYCKGDLQSCGLGFVSIAENNFENENISIFQNASHNLQINVHSNRNLKWEYFIESLDGRNIAKGESWDSDIELTIKKKISTGLYICSIYYDNKIFIKKINLNY